ncbi:hypothetical protein [Hyalangium gracile]|uniref:hypothetical protein n=1 Tax=Hyalangium gracile TaxID=394092 RepID=UPI001CCC7BA6|nr:hypothetical protein [Hyalangium gracile]
MGCSEAPPPEEPGAPGPEELIPGRPDFEFATVKGPSELSPRASGPLRALLCNRGDTDGSTEVSFYFSYNNTFEPFDKWVTTTEPIFVPAGGCEDVSELVARPNVPDASYHLIAVADVDMLVSEGREGNNARVGVGKFTVDFHAPPRPVLKWVAGEYSTGRPLLEVTSEVNDFVYVYSGERCEGEPVAESRVGSSSFCYMPIDLSGIPSSSYSVRVVDFVDNASACSSILAPTDYGTPLPAPVITEASWQYASVEHDLRVRGTAQPGAEVGIFIDARCTGFPAATVFAGTQGAFTAELKVPASPVGTLRRVFVAARDENLRESSCVEGPTYQTPCPQGYSNCDGNPANGCEVNLTEDANHCGACGTSCQDRGNAEGVCISGTCGVACPVGTYDCDGNPVNGCESTTVCSPAVCTVDSAEELLITSLSVVEDPVRTAPGGAWHFGTLMRQMAGNEDPSTLVRQWLRTWNTTQRVNGLTLPARPQMQSQVLAAWEARSGGPDRPLDFSKAPFRLLAIVNRMDLRNPGVQAGEGRFVFGVLDAAGNPLEFTVILEYALPGGTPEAIQGWARDWHELGQLGLGHPSYKVKLQALTDRFTNAGVMAGRPHGNALNQIRTNEVALADEWEMREFVLTSTALQPATVKRTPDLGFENTNALRNFILANQADVLAERHTVPESLNGVRFLAARAPVPEDFFWRVPGVPGEARHKFSLNTCSGCHSRETGTEFTHIAPRAAGQAAALSAYLRGGTLPDPVTGVSRSFNDLSRRAEDLKALVCGSTSALSLTSEHFGGFPAASNLPPARVH